LGGCSSGYKRWLRSDAGTQWRAPALGPRGHHPSSYLAVMLTGKRLTTPELGTAITSR
jgi:hypothetical protein